MCCTILNKSMISFLLFLLIAVMAQGTSLGHVQFFEENDPSRIYGGEDAPPLPYMAGLLHKDGKSYAIFCGGSLISEEAILTAAHCVYNTHLPEESIAFFGHTLLFDGDGYYLKEFVLHENYDPTTMKNDIALAKPKNKIVTKPNRSQPIRWDEKKVGANENVQISGWGRIYDNGPTSSKLQIFNTTTYDMQKCKGEFTKGAGMYVGKGQICTKSKDKGACMGDSGGPVVKDNLLVGVVSFGPNICELHLATIHTEVASYSGWIKAHMKV